MNNSYALVYLCVNNICALLCQISLTLYISLQLPFNCAKNERLNYGEFSSTMKNPLQIEAENYASERNGGRGRDTLYTYIRRLYQVQWCSVVQRSMEVRRRERTIKGEQGRLVREWSKANAASREKEGQDQTHEVDSNFRSKIMLVSLSLVQEWQSIEVNQDELDSSEIWLRLTPSTSFPALWIRKSLTRLASRTLPKDRTLSDNYFQLKLIAINNELVKKKWKICTRYAHMTINVCFANLKDFAC